MLGGDLMFCKVKFFCEGTKDVKNVELKEVIRCVVALSVKLSVGTSHTCVVVKTMCGRRDSTFVRGYQTTTHLGKTFVASYLKMMLCDKVQHHLCKFYYFEA